MLRLRVGEEGAVVSFTRTCNQSFMRTHNGEERLTRDFFLTPSYLVAFVTVASDLDALEAMRGVCAWSWYGLGGSN